MTIHWKLFASIFALIFVAELPGKTTFANVLMASRGRPLPILAGAAAAFLVHSAVAVAAGSLIAYFPPRAVGLAVGLVFLLLAVALWREKQDGVQKEAGAQAPFGRAAAKSFGIIFFAQWGDPTQLATAALAAKYPAPWTVFFSATLSLWAVTALAVGIGHHSKKMIQPRLLQRAAALVFAALGLALLARAMLA